MNAAKFPRGCRPNPAQLAGLKNGTVTLDQSGERPRYQSSSISRARIGEVVASGDQELPLGRFLGPRRALVHPVVPRPFRVFMLYRLHLTDLTRCSTSSTFSWRAASRATFMPRSATRLSGL